MATIVSAVGSSANALVPASKPLARRIEQAMVQTVLDATAEGIIHPAEMRKRLTATRERVIASID